MTPNVPTIDRGTERLGMMVAGTLRRNRNMTITTSATARANSNFASATEARMVVVRSLITESWTSAGSAASRVGSSCLIRSTTSMTFAPGWR